MAESTAVERMTDSFADLKNRASTVFTGDSMKDTLDSIKSYMKNGEDKFSNLMSKGMEDVQSHERLSEMRKELDSFTKNVSSKIGSMSSDKQKEATRFMEDFKRHYEDQAEKFKSTAHEKTNQ